MQRDSPNAEKLNIYSGLLKKWNPAINLVAPGTLEQVDSRHFADSAQLGELLSEGAKTLVDFGSGAGFPGLVLAILRPDLDVHLIESDQRKCAFLSTVSRETLTPVTIHNNRIESIEPFNADVLTARALAALDILLGHSRGWFRANPDLVALFLKGRTAAQEIFDAQAQWNFDVRRDASCTDPDACILRISGLKSCE